MGGTTLDEIQREIDCCLDEVRAAIILLAEETWLDEFGTAVAILPRLERRLSAPPPRPALDLRALDADDRATLQQDPREGRAGGRRRWCGRPVAPFARLRVRSPAAAMDPGAQDRART